MDVMHYLWTGAWPANRSPRLEGAWLDGKTAPQNVRLKAGQTYTAKVQASDPDQDPLTYSWDVMEESAETQDGRRCRDRSPSAVLGIDRGPQAE